MRKLIGLIIGGGIGFGGGVSVGDIFYSSLPRGSNGIVVTTGLILGAVIGLIITSLSDLEEKKQVKAYIRLSEKLSKQMKYYRTYGKIPSDYYYWDLANNDFNNEMMKAVNLCRKNLVSAINGTQPTGNIKIVHVATFIYPWFPRKDCKSIKVYEDAYLTYKNESVINREWGGRALYYIGSSNSRRGSSATYDVIEYRDAEILQQVSEVFNHFGFVTSFGELALERRYETPCIRVYAYIEVKS